MPTYGIIEVIDEEHTPYGSDCSSRYYALNILYSASNIDDIQSRLRNLIKNELKYHKMIRIVYIDNSIDIDLIGDRQMDRFPYCNIMWACYNSGRCAFGCEREDTLRCTPPSIIAYVDGNVELLNQTLFNIKGMREYFDLGYKVFTENWSKKMLKEEFKKIGYPNKKIRFRSKCGLQWSYLEKIYQQTVLARL